jgi:hypothetical protein
MPFFLQWTTAKEFSIVLSQIQQSNYITAELLMEMLQSLGQIPKLFPQGKVY